MADTLFYSFLTGMSWTAIGIVLKCCACGRFDVVFYSLVQSALAKTDYWSYVWNFRLQRAFCFGILAMLGRRLAPVQKWRHILRDWEY